MSIFDKKSALTFLRSAHVFYYSDPDPDKEYQQRVAQSLNMNDTFGWALAYGPHIPDDNLVEVAELFWRYGNGGLYYWCTICPDEEERMNGSEFEDIQRAIDFVRHEEKERLSGKSSDERAYHKLVYTLGKRKKV